VKLLVFAQTPPPLHGQSVMVQALLDGLRQQPGFAVHHVNFRLSRDHGDIGRWRLEKIALTIGLALRAIALRLRHGCDTLYYVPTPPGKRGALYRDFVVMALCRPFFRHLVLHWHAPGLGEWLQHRGSGLERWLARQLLGRASLALVLGASLRRDADYFLPHRLEVVPNGIADPGAPPPTLQGSRDFEALFLGLCSEEKGLFAAIDAVIAANRARPAAGALPRFRLVAAGPFADASSATRFQQLATAHPGMLRHVGFVAGEEKSQLFAATSCLIFPTRYAAEGMPLVALEALAHDRPVIATRWRALPEVVTAEVGRLVAVGNPIALADALLDLKANPPTPGACRARYLANYTLERHLTALRAALSSLLSGSS
jgi:glycosyltransferase involved in cell wall biosynthesis